MFKNVINIGVLAFILASGVSLGATPGDPKRQARKFDAPPTEKLEKRQAVQLDQSPLWQRGRVPDKPLVTKEGGEYKVDPDFKNTAKLLMDMSDLSYALVASSRELRPDATPEQKALHDAEKQKYEDGKRAMVGWEFTPFEGTSGFALDDPEQNAKLDKTVSKLFEGNAQFDEPSNKDGKKSNVVGTRRDKAGFVATNKATGEIMVIFHGSQDMHDWKDNFNSKKVPLSEMGIGEGLEGFVHKGNALRYQSVRDQIDSIATKFVAELDPKVKPKIYTAGHSLGGAMATVAFADISTRLAKKLFGKYYKNAVGNAVQTVAFSPSRALSEEAVDSMKKQGAGVDHNLIIDATRWDPVKRFGMGKKLTKYLKEASRFGPTKLVMVVLKKLGISPTSNPQKFAEEHGGAKLPGAKAVISSKIATQEAKPLHEGGSPIMKAVAPWHGGVVTGKKGAVMNPELYKNMAERESYDRRIKRGQKNSKTGLTLPETRGGQLNPNAPKLGTNRLKPAAVVAEPKTVQNGKNRPQKVASVGQAPLVVNEHRTPAASAPPRKSGVINEPITTRPVAVKKTPIAESAKPARQPRAPSGAHGQVTRARARTLP